MRSTRLTLIFPPHLRNLIPSSPAPRSDEAWRSPLGKPPRKLTGLGFHLRTGASTVMRGLSGKESRRCTDPCVNGVMHSSRNDATCVVQCISRMAPRDVSFGVWRCGTSTMTGSRIIMTESRLTANDPSSHFHQGGLMQHRSIAHRKGSHGFIGDGGTSFPQIRI